MLFRSFANLGLNIEGLYSFHCGIVRRNVRVFFFFTNGTAIHDAGGGRAAAEERPITIPWLETPARSAPCESVAPPALPAPRGGAPGTCGEGGSVLGLRSTLPRDRALSQPLLQLTVPNSSHFIASSSDRFPLWLPYSGLIAASPEGPAHSGSL